MLSGRAEPLPHPAQTIPCGERETGPRLSFSQLITMVCLPETCGIVLYLQELGATVTVCGFLPSGVTHAGANPQITFLPTPKRKQEVYLLNKSLFL